MSHPPSTNSPAATSGNDLNLPVIGLVTGVAGVVVFVIIMLIQVWYFDQLNRELESKSLGQTNQPLLDLNFQQQKNLETYRWVDQSKGVVAIPIDRAVELYIARHRGPATQPAHSPAKP